MKINKLSILFLLDKTKMNKQGKCPVRCRMTYFGKRKLFSTGLFINPDHWHSKYQQAHPPNKENDFINAQLSLIKQQINQAFLLLQYQGESFTVDDIYRKFKGEPESKEKAVLEVFEEHNQRVKKLVGKDYVMATFWKLRQAKELLASYIKFEYKKDDYAFKDLDLGFIKEYEFYLKSEKNLAQATVYKAIQRFRKIIKIAIAKRYLDKDPFILYEVKRPKKQVVYLTPEELKKLEKHNFSQRRLQEVKDMFVFCCYTGLAYQEMADLEPKHIVKGFDGKLWIYISRKKTNRVVSIPLLPPAIRIIEQYKGGSKVLPVISNQKFNSYLKEIADVVGIEKKLTHHIARKTFASTVLLYNNVPMEIVSELLGHSSIKITQEHYGKVVQKKVSEEMKRLSRNFKKQHLKSKKK
ncbi:site-specific integrase [Sinomicrobium pectinilyticum]|uniref:Site-specific integrase n=1 Tax=Sinomicrobium pectinilyticum TaxID=1084421 RepID=A0A3N0E602_SINP1|nr:site-specific integrase [Sinomicrobium pectinilyticum]RNL83264.1 site-specific integrase [Sinomicrobium pectinilyticum]